MPSWQSLQECVYYFRINQLSSTSSGEQRKTRGCTIYTSNFPTEEHLYTTLRSVTCAAPPAPVILRQTYKVDQKSTENLRTTSLFQTLLRGPTNTKPIRTHPGTVTSCLPPSSRHHKIGHKLTETPSILFPACFISTPSQLSSLFSKRPFRPRAFARQPSTTANLLQARRELAQRPTKIPQLVVRRTSNQASHEKATSQTGSSEHVSRW